MTAMPERQNYRILMVEDDALDYELIMTAAAEIGVDHRFDRVETGEQALERLSDPDAALPDLIWLDLRLPGMDGPEILEQIKADERTRLIPVVIVTSSTLEKDRERCYRAGASAFCEKPRRLEQIEQFLGSLEDFWAGHVLGPA